jgi:hypothetical protein
MSQPTPRLSSLFKLEYPQSVGVYGTYDEAQQVVDFLADSRFPVENLCIVGTELKSIERVLGRRSWGTVIGQGVQSGLSTGVMITLLMWIFMPAANFLFLVVSALAIGIFVGVLMAALGYWMSQGKRDFRSVSQTMATKYELLAEHKVAGHARELIGSMPGARAAAFNPVQVNPGQGGPAYPASGYPQQGYGQPYPPVYPPQGYGQPYPQQYPAPTQTPYAAPPQVQPAPEPSEEPPSNRDDSGPGNSDPKNS